MALRHVLTGGLGYAPGGLRYLPTRGLTPRVPFTPSRAFLIPARFEVALEAAAWFQTTLAAAARFCVSFLRPASITMVPLNPYSLLSWYRGEDIAVNFPLSPGTSIAGMQLTCLVKDADGTTVLTKTAAVDTPSAGYFQLAFPSADTAALPVARYTWSVRRQPAGQKADAAHGHLDLLQEVTP